MAKKYNEKEVADWSVNDMLSYLSDQHLARFNVDYQPFGTWASERGSSATGSGPNGRPASMAQNLRSGLSTCAWRNIVRREIIRASTSDLWLRI